MRYLKLIAISFLILLMPFSTQGYDISCRSDLYNILEGESYILVTGFGPFGNHEINPSQLIAESLNGTIVNGIYIVGVTLPVDFNDSVDLMIQKIKQYQPLYVLSIGLDAGSENICIEKVGWNLRKDNYSNKKLFDYYKLDPNGPFIRLSNLPTFLIAKEIRDAGIPSRNSFFPGLYICNALLFGTLSYICTNSLDTKACFIHVPLMSTQAPSGMKLEKMIDAINITIDFLC